MQTIPVPGLGGEKNRDGLSQVEACVCVRVRDVQLPIGEQGEEAPQGLWVQTFLYLCSIIMLP